MEDQGARDDSSSGLEQDNSSSDTEAALCEAAEHHDQYRRRFQDAVVQSEWGFGEYGRRTVSVQTNDIAVTTEASGFDYTSPRLSPEVLDDADIYSGPAEWRDVWEWEVGECNRLFAEENTLMYDEAEDCSDSDETVGNEDALGLECDEYDPNECCFQLFVPQRQCGLLNDSEDMGSAVMSSVVVNEPMFAAQSTTDRSSVADSGDETGTDAVSQGTAAAHGIQDDETFQAMLAEVLDSCRDSKVSWDSADESGLTELDRAMERSCGAAEFSRDSATSNGSDGRFLSVAGHSNSWDHEMDAEYVPDLYPQRSSYGTGVHGRSMDSKCSFPYTSASSSDDTCRWPARPKKSFWRKNSNDGLDSAGCSPKDDEDDDSDDDARDSGAAATLKQNKVSPASGYYGSTKSDYWQSHTVKDDGWRSNYDDRQRRSGPSESSSACRDPSDGGYYGSRYPRLRQENNSSGGRESGDAIIQRMMRRKEAKRKRESAGLSAADDVAGYRGKDCSIEELIEYIDAKPPEVPKPGQKQNCNRKNRKKKRGSNRQTNWDESDSKSGKSRGHRSDSSGPNSGKMPCENSAGAAISAANNNNAGTTEKPECHSSSGDDKMDGELVTELPLHCDTYFQMVSSDSSASNMSDADNIMDFVTDPNLSGHRSSYTEPQSATLDIPVSVAGLERDIVGELSEKHDPEECVSVNKPIIQSSAMALSDEVDDVGTSVQDCHDFLPTVGSEPEKDPTGLEGEDTRNSGPSVLCKDDGILNNAYQEEIGELDSADHVCSLQRRHSAELNCCTSTHHEIVSKPTDINSWKFQNHELRLSTPCSSISDAHDSADFDCQSWADDMSSDFDFSSVQTSHDNEFTVVTQKKKKKPVRRNVSSADCIQRTFYNRNRWNKPSPWVQEPCTREPTLTHSFVPVTCSFSSSSASTVTQSVLCPSRVTQVESEVSASADVAPSLPDDGMLVEAKTASGTDSTSSLTCRETVGTNVGCCTDSNGLICNQTSSQATSSFAASVQNTLQTAENVHSSSRGFRIQEKVFLDTRRPDAGVVSALETTELSFWYDVTVSAESLFESDAMLTSSSVSSASCTTVTSSSPLSSIACDSDVNTVSCSTTDTTVSSSDSVLLDKVAAMHLGSHCPVTPIDSISQSREQVLPSERNTPPCGLSPSSDNDCVNSSNCVCSVGCMPAGCRVITPPVHSASDAISHVGRQSSGIGRRQQFDLHGAQLFLYNGPERVIYFADSTDKDSH